MTSPNESQPPAQPQTPPSDPPKPSPLGEDPPTPQEPPATPEPEVPAEPEGISEEELADLREKAQAFDYIQADSQAASMLADHFKAKRGRVNKPTQPSIPPPEGEDEVTKLRKELAEANQRQANEIAALRVQQFRQLHPDMDEVKDGMAHLINNFGMDLDTAYNYAKAAKQQAEAQANGEAPGPAEPTTETKTAGRSDESSEGSDIIKKAEQLIADRKATPRIEDAFDVALEAAKKLTRSS